MSLAAPGSVKNSHQTLLHYVFTVHPHVDLYTDSKILAWGGVKSTVHCSPTRGSVHA